VTVEALELAAQLAALFAGDLAPDGKVDPETVETAVDLALCAGVSALPDELDVDGYTIPVALLVESLLRPAIERGVDAIIEATRPARLIVEQPEQVIGFIHD
jgi:hypothetical protein